MRESVILSSVRSQMLSAEAATAWAAFATPEGIVAVTLNVFGSMRAIEAAPQTGAQRLLKAETIPPHGLFRSLMGSPFLLVFGSIFSRVSLAGAKTDAEKNTHSGLARASISASALRLAIGICTPGV